jgi:hypothetical protein
MLDFFLTLIWMVSIVDSSQARTIRVVADDGDDTFSQSESLKRMVSKTRVSFYRRTREPVHPRVGIGVWLSCLLRASLP